MVLMAEKLQKHGECSKTVLLSCMCCSVVDYIK